MNTQLYNSLISAREFLITVEKKGKDIQHLKKEATTGGVTFSEVMSRIPDAKDRPKEFSWGTCLLLTWLTGIGGIIYSIYISRYNAKCNEKWKKKQEMLSSTPEAIKRKNEILNYREEKKKELKSKTIECNKYFSDNYYQKLGFLPDWARKIETIEDIIHQREYIEGLIYQVKYGAQTLSEAMERHGIVLREIAEIEERKEQREYMKEQQTKESIGNRIHNGGNNSRNEANSTISQDSRFTYYDGRGNYSQSGNVFYDGKGNLCEWGSPFYDFKGNYCEWGSAFYDSRGNLCEWSSPFYDGKGNYIVP